MGVPPSPGAETRSWYQSDPLENQTCHTDEEGASLACYQSTLFSGTSFFSQWYFPSFERSTNEILWEIVASSSFLCPSRLRHSLARSHETRFSRPNRRACSQAMENDAHRGGCYRPRLARFFISYENRIQQLFYYPFKLFLNCEHSYLLAVVL